MKTFLRSILTVLTIVTGVATIIGLYLQWTDKKPVIDVRLISVENLTNKPKVTGLDATYKFNDSIVNNLWRGYYIIENVGNETIIGTGANKNIITEKLRITPSSKFRILNSEVKNNNFPIQIQKDSNNFLLLDFLQWRQDEYFELQVYFEGIPGDTLNPSISINEREILNANVKYSIFKPSEKDKKIIADYLPGFFHWILWVLGLLSFGLGFIVMPIFFVSEAIQVNKYKSWQKEWGSLYDEWIRQMIAQKKLTYQVKPDKLPENLWKEFTGVRPKIPSNLNDMRNLFIATIVVMLLSAIPIIWMIRV